MALLLGVAAGPVPWLVIVVANTRSYFISSSANIDIGPLLYLIGDNRLHPIHHSVEPQHVQHNFGTSTPLWDMLFGAACFPRAHEWPKVGLAEIQEPKTLRKYLLMPSVPESDPYGVRMRKLFGSGLLLVVSVLLCLVLAEVATRVADGLSLSELRLPAAIGAIGLDTTAAELDKVPRAAGVERDWFFKEPPPLPNRSQPPQEWIDLDRLIESAGRNNYHHDFKPWDMFKAWNAAFVGDPCKDSFFSSAPGRLFVFDPPDGNPRPIYRYMPNATTPMGLVTNQFGFRGPPVPFARSANTVRIVFVGASTTAGAHAAAYSYPELVGHWLNMWAATRRPDIRFEVLNAGREAITSPDIAAIVHQEVAPLRPDLVVYYEGANQFQEATVVKDVPAISPVRPDAKPDGVVTRWLRDASHYSALARRTQALVAAVELPEGGGEWPKPDYKLDWPQDVDEFDPDLGRADLPVHLSAILRDLDLIRADLAAVDGELALSSFKWLVRDGMVLNPIRNRIILEYINTYHFPFRYRDIERLAAFQNRVFAKYAATHGLAFVDEARVMPFDPDLFADAIHNTYPGMRLQAWVVLQQLLPFIEKRLASGAWPKPVPVMGDTHPAFAAAPRQITFDCKSP